MRYFNMARKLVVLGSAWAFLVSIPCLGSSRAADHRDGPRVTDSASTLGALDLNDVYLFASPSNRNNSVLILTTGGAGVGVLTPPIFFPGAVYEFRISNDGDPLTDEIVYQFVFSDADQFLRQSYVVVGLNPKTGASQLLARGVTGGRKGVNLKGGGKVVAGIFDDPFFFDSQAFNRFRSAAQDGLPLASRVAPFLSPSIPNNFFGNFNVLAIIIEVPRLKLQSSKNNPNITLWTRCLTPAGDQFDRTALPAINTAVLFGIPRLGLANLQDTFNSLKPSDDPGLRSIAAQRINLNYGLALDAATSLAGVVLPDVMPFNTTSTAGFLNGRKLSDDVIDAELDLLTGGALKSDRVINDSVFSASFPYLGPPLPRAALR
jgi:Domain of unknown function (DUF4331)